MANAASTTSDADKSSSAITLARVPLDRPWSWLAKGFADFRRAPLISLLYGLVFTAAGYLLIGSLWALGWLYLTLPGRVYDRGPVIRGWALRGQPTAATR